MEIKRIIYVLLLLSISGCTNLTKLQKMDAAMADAFNRALSIEYLRFAEQEAIQYDWYDSEYFAKKGIKAASGQPTFPEQLRDWGIEKQYQDELTWARNRLISLLDEHTKSRYPKEAAKVQALFDCWVEQQEEKWQKDDIDACRLEYLLEIAALERKSSIMNSASIPEPVEQLVSLAESSPPVKVTPKHSETYVIHFLFGSTELDAKAEKTISNVLNTSQNMTEYLVEISGHTDRAGPIEFNQNLSSKRATTVADRLRELGVVIEEKNIEYFGETKPVVATDDGVANVRNRRVEINIQGH